MEVVKSEFKNPIFLYKATKAVDKRIEEIKLKIEKSTQGYKLTKSIFPKPPLPEQLFDAMKQGWPEIESLIKNVSGYPEGDIETILKLWGRYENYKKAKEFVGSDVFHFLNYYEKEYIFKDGTFIFNKKIIKEIEDQHTYYTKNDKQNKTLEGLSKLAESLNLAFDNGILWYDQNPRSFDSITKSSIVRDITKLLSVHNNKVVPDFDAIRVIKE